MRRQSRHYRTTLALGCAVMVSLLASPAPVLAINLSLNLIYDNPAIPSLGGDWQVVAKLAPGEGQSIAALSFWLDGTGTRVSRVPSGTVNGSDVAGFIAEHGLFDGHRNFAIGQAPYYPSAPAGNEQTVFYGVGTLDEGWPYYAGTPVGSNFTGPFFDTLTGVSNVPWAAGPDFKGDPDWNVAAMLFSGEFAANTPQFYVHPTEPHSGNVFPSVGDSSSAPLPVAATITTTVRTNLPTATADADYNDDGFVNAADYSIWRNQLGMSMPGLAADGAGPGGPGVPDGTVDRLDYDFWKDQYGIPLGSGSGNGVGGMSVPEPGSGCLLVIGAWLCGAAGRFRGRSAGLKFRRS
ncbi:MAG: hypothetical protein WD669_01125 [Pirellulales bacterium]